MAPAAADLPHTAAPDTTAPDTTADPGPPATGDPGQGPSSPPVVPASLTEFLS